MGMNESKLPDSKTNPTDEMGSIPSTSIHTPVSAKGKLGICNNIDPRSPSQFIARTPIQFDTSLHDSSTLSIETTDLDRPAIDTPMKHHLILGIDPRSPTLEIQRTPVVVSHDKQLPAVIRNKNLERVKRSFGATVPTRVQTSPGPTQRVSPKLLSVNKVVPKAKTESPEKRKSLMLLETNIDYTETDLDVVIQRKYMARNNPLSISVEEPSLDIVDPRSPSLDYLRTPILAAENETDKCVEKNDICCEDSKMEEEIIKPIAEIEISDSDCPLSDDHPDLLVDGSKLENSIEYLLVEATEEIVVIETEPSNPKPVAEPYSSLLLVKSAPGSPPTKFTVTPKATKSEPTTPPVIDLTSELDKKLTNLIYEDQNCVTSSKTVKQSSRNRTPLATRNRGEEPKKGVGQKLKVHDKPRKSELGHSRIPVFKDKKIKVQCENTPPKGMRPLSGNQKKTRWDQKDDTLVI